MRQMPGNTRIYTRPMTDISTTTPLPDDTDRGLLTPEQVAQFDRDGDLVLKQRIDAALLARPRAAS